MVETKRFGNRVEVHGVDKVNKLEHAKLKADGFRWYPPKMCWTKYEVVPVPTVDEYEQEMNQCIDCALEQNEMMEEMQRVIDKQNEEIEFLRNRQPVTKPKRPSKKGPSWSIKNFTAKCNTLPILQKYCVKDGKVIATDMEKYIIMDTKLHNGIYESIDERYDPVISLGDHFDDYVQLPEIESDREIVFNDEEIEELKRIVKDAEAFVLKQNFSPLFTGVRFNGRDIVGTDSFSLYVYETKRDFGKFIIPKENLCCLYAMSGKTTMKLAKNSGHHDMPNMVSFICEGIQTNSLCISGSIPDYRHKKITPQHTTDPIMFDISELLSKVKVVGNGKDAMVSIKDGMANIKYTKAGGGEYVSEGYPIFSPYGLNISYKNAQYLNGKFIQIQELSEGDNVDEPITMQEGNMTYVCRPLSD